MFGTVSRASLFLVALLFAQLASAQATRTWVSGVGDDANPCSRTAPCKTFAGAISKTATGGVISVLDPGGFGGVTITKSITIEGDSETAGILVSGSNGIVVNGANVDVVIQGIKLESVVGPTPGLSGVFVAQGRSVVLDDVVISGFSIAGVRATTGAVTINNSRILNNQNGASNAAGVEADGAAASVNIDNSLFTGNDAAINVRNNGTIRLSNSSFYNNKAAFGCSGPGTISSTGNNRKAANSGGTVPVCTPNATTTVQ